MPLIVWPGWPLIWKSFTDYLKIDMIYTPQEYCEVFLFENVKVSPRTVRRRASKGMLPSNHKARKLPGEKGIWIIEVIEKAN